jgi:hypothetical protein
MGNDKIRKGATDRVNMQVKDEVLNDQKCNAREAAICGPLNAFYLNSNTFFKGISSNYTSEMTTYTKKVHKIASK